MLPSSAKVLSRYREGDMDAIIEVLAVVVIFGGLFAAFHKHFVEG